MKNFKKTGGFKTPLFKALLADGMREKLSYAFVKDGFVYASNGVILIKQSLSEIHEIDEDQQKFIEGKSFHHDLLKQLWKFKFVEFTENSIKAGDGKANGEFEYSTQIESPNFDILLSYEVEMHAIRQMGIMPKQLSILSDVMDLHTYGQGGVILKFVGHNKMAFAFASYDSIDIQIGLIMPTETNED